jgi:hypothetical protein
MPSKVHASQSKLLGALTVTALAHLGDSAVVVDEDNAILPDWRMARLGDIVLLRRTRRACRRQSVRRSTCSFSVMSRGSFER